MSLFSKLQKILDTPEKAFSRAYFSYFERNGYGPPVEEIMEELERHELHRQLSIYMYKEGNLSKEELEKSIKKMVLQLNEFLLENKLTIQEYLEITNRNA